MARRDDEEYVEFVRAVARSLRRTAYLLCGDWQRAEDAVQEALVRVYVAWPRLDRSGGLHSYAHRALVSSALDEAKRRGGDARRRPLRLPNPQRQVTRWPSSTTGAWWSPRSRISLHASVPAWSFATTRTGR